MRVCIYVYVCMCADMIYVYICMCVHLCVYTRVYVYVYANFVHRLRVLVSVLQRVDGVMHAHKCVFVCICMRIHMCVGIYICAFLLQ